MVNVITCRKTFLHKDIGLEKLSSSLREHLFYGIKNKQQQQPTKQKQNNNKKTTNKTY